VGVPEGVRLKLERAQQHLDALQQEIERFLRRHPYTVIEEFNEEAGEYLLRAQVLEEPPSRWGVEVGDVVHNLRSALDHLVWQLALSHGGTAPSGTEFPVFVDETAFKRSSKGGGRYKIRGISPDAKTIIEALQPYHAGENTERHWLWALQQISNWDKHRTIHVVGAVLANSAYQIQRVEDAEFGISESVAYGPFVDGAVVARFSLTPTGPNPKVYMNSHFFFEVAFDQEGPGRGEVIFVALSNFRMRVREIAARLSDFASPIQDEPS
jgi:hypothetical protein